VKSKRSFSVFWERKFDLGILRTEIEFPSKVFPNFRQPKNRNEMNFLDFLAGNYFLIGKVDEKLNEISERIALMGRARV
jgi:hypothetical protein